MDYLARARRVLALEAGELHRLHDRLDGEAFGRAVGLILRCLEGRGKIVVVGVGKSGLVGGKIAATLTSTGSPAVVLHSQDALHGDLGLVADGDVVLALSASGETEELVALLPALLRGDVRLVSFCGRADSTLARCSHVWLDVSVGQEACPLNLAPTSSTTVMLALGDALAMVLLEARGFREEDFARFHPGGQLGRRLLWKVNQVMRPRDQTPVVGLATPLREVLREMTRRRAGAAVVVDAQGRVAGIFTHGDFVRRYDQAPDGARLGDQPVGDHMTADPVRVGGEKLAVEILNLLARSRVDDLVVVDEANRPIGLVDSQDLTRLKLV